MSFYNWVRVRDAAGNQFDVYEDSVLDEGVTRVKGYPIHRSQTARPGKPHIDLRTTTVVDGYAALTVPKLDQEISKRIADGREISPVSHRKADLVAALEADDAAPVTPDSSDDLSDTGENHQTEAGSTGQESE